MSTEPLIPAPPPMLRTDSLSRLTSTAVGVFLSFVTTMMTARWLGPAGKGNLSTLAYVCAVSSYVASLGIGEASVVLVNRNGITLNRLMSSALLPLILAAAVTAGSFVLVATFVSWTISSTTVAIAAVLVVVGTFAYAATGFEVARFRIAFSSRALVVSNVVTVGATAAFVGVLDWGLSGAVLALLVGSSTALFLLISDLWPDFAFPKLGIERTLLGLGLRVGAALEGAHLLMALAQRADLLVVYWMRGAGAAGIYSVALTLGQLPAFAAGALSYSAFARVSASEEPRGLTLRVARMSLLIGMLTAGVLAVVMPIAVSLLLGTRFIESVSIAWALSLGAVLWGVTAALSRAAAAMGRTLAFPAAFGVTLIAMLGLDAVLIGPLGLTGAAVASVAGCAAGLVVCLSGYRRAGETIQLRYLFPQPSDLQDLLDIVRATLARSRL